MNDNESPEEFEALVLRVHCRRIAQLCEVAGREVPPGVKARVAGDSLERIEADNTAYADWCRSHGVEALTSCYPDWKSVADPGPVALAEV